MIRWREAIQQDAHLRERRVDTRVTDRARGALHLLVDGAHRQGRPRHLVRRAEQELERRRERAQQVFERRHTGQASDRSASRTFSGCSAASGTRFQCFFTLPSGPIHTVERMTPVVFLPYIIFSP